jgi:hypothetical protein
MNTAFHFDARKFAKWCLAVLMSGWVIGSTWFVFLQPAQLVYRSYGSQESQLAKCRDLPTSETRYQCTARLMLAKDNDVFNRTLIILLPPFAALIGYLAVMKAVATHRDRVKKREAHIASRRRLAEWRNHLNEIKAGTRQTEDVFLNAHEHPSGPRRR